MVFLQDLEKFALPIGLAHFLPEPPEKQNGMHYFLTVPPVLISVNKFDKNILDKNDGHTWVEEVLVASKYN